MLENGLFISITNRSSNCINHRQVHLINCNDSRWELHALLKMAIDFPHIWGGEGCNCTRTQSYSFSPPFSPGFIFCVLSAVGIATGYGLDDREVGVRVPVESRIFSFPRHPDRPALGPTHPPIQWVPGALYPGVKRPGHIADHSPPTSAEVKETLIYTSTPPYAFMA
jgi:hypothetical protein